MQVSSLGSLQVTAVAGGFDFGVQGLTTELRMVRAALLYADEVVFCSQRPELLAQDEFMGAASERIDELAVLRPRIGSWRAAMEELAAVVDGSIAATEAPALEAMSDVFAVADPELLRAAAERVSQTFTDLDELEATGLVRRIEIPAGWPMDEQAIHGLEAIDDVLVDAAAGKTMPLLDAGAWEYAQTSSVEGAQPAIDHASVGGGLVDTIEGYADAPLDVLLDVRDDLQPYLASFRGAVLRFVDQLPSRSEPTFEASLHALYLREVAPVLEELDAAMRRTGAKTAMRRVAIEAGSAAVPGTLAIVAGLSDLFSIAATALGGALGAEAVRRHTPPTAENRALTWLWKAKGRLSASA